MLLMEYNLDAVREAMLQQVSEIKNALGKTQVTWLSIVGLQRTDVIKQLEETFQVHAMALEDILNTDHRPKLETNTENNYLYVVLKNLYYNDLKELQLEQVSLILGTGYVVTVQEKAGTAFENIRLRVRNGHGRVRKMKEDYLFYALLDSILDSYFVVLDKFNDKLERFEEQLIERQYDPDMLQHLYDLQREYLLIRKALWPVRDVTYTLLRLETTLAAKGIQIYLKDLHDSAVQTADVLETCRDMLANMVNHYHSHLTQHMNAVMKVLTIITTIFIPLSFVVGVYGMNFKHMPELEWQFAYPMLMLLLLAIALAMLVFFRRRRWI